tara:strand:+ start:108 stop:341 length:234 start_codon:yes stop_codon:yes gene_type:complete
LLLGVSNGPFFSFMKIQAIRNVAVAGQHLNAGEVREVSEADGSYLIRNNKAIAAVEAPACPPKPPVKPKAKKATNGT